MRAAPRAQHREYLDIRGTHYAQHKKREKAEKADQYANERLIHGYAEWIMPGEHKCRYESTDHQ